ncbi:MAG: arylamine N-acetyltransferase [Gammaproteobacteria bacterium]|nr:arylamine N-acetyltransferase [Gammaproteobacteria bacterium]MDH3433506.1 arylamine N-acetyltransferase [Gammaproteobacteria bacterium]
MQLRRYFQRIGYNGECHPTLAVLEALQATHVCAVPFENIDVQLGRPVTTAVESAYEKIVCNGRGGWCYEQNGLFGWALSEIGFRVTRLAASVMRQERGAVANANHLCLLVSCPGLEAEFLVDVGFGGSMIAPVELRESEHWQPPFRIGLRKVPDFGWRFWEDIGKGEFSYDFAVQAADEAALTEKSTFLQTDPASNFVLNLVTQLRLPQQHRTLRGRVLSIASPDGIESRTIESADELVAVLASHFSLHLPEVADLWPKITVRHDELFRENDSGDTYDIRACSHNQPLS